MAVLVVSTAQTSVPYMDVNVFNTVVVTPTGSLVNGGSGAYFISNWASLVNGGMIAGIDSRNGNFQAAGILVSPFYNLAQTLSITQLASGTIYGDWDGILVQAGRVLTTNAGSISGRTGYHVTGNADGNGMSTIRNTGTIEGFADGIRVDLLTGVYHDLTIRNDGVIRGQVSAISVLDDDSVVTLTNNGTVDGYIQTGGGADLIINRGQILNGAISMGGGADTFDNRQGKTDGLSVDLGAGDDVMLMGRLAEFVSGGDGVDRVSYATSAPVTVNMSNLAANRGAAAGDIYVGVEDIEGSDKGGDKLTGDAGDNRLFGIGGADTLVGGAGADWLEGGQGADVLTGGTGADRFVFRGPGEGVDQITDFVKGAAQDKIAIYGEAFGGLAAGSLPGAWFVARADNLAQDGNDRFVFNTTDHSLWFDPDGNGAAAPIQICTVAASVTLAASDILIF